MYVYPLIFELDIMTGRKKHFFKGNDLNDRDGWIKALRDACKVTVNGVLYLWTFSQLKSLRIFFPPEYWIGLEKFTNYCSLVIRFVLSCQE